MIHYNNNNNNNPPSADSRDTPENPRIPPKIFDTSPNRRKSRNLPRFGIEDGLTQGRVDTRKKPRDFNYSFAGAYHTKFNCNLDHISYNNPHFGDFFL